MAIVVLSTHHQAITTRFLGPTNTRGPRVVASCQAGRVTVGWDHGISVEENHEAACRALAAKFDWQGEWRGGGSHSGDGSVFVCVRREIRS